MSLFNALDDMRDRFEREAAELKREMEISSELHGCVSTILTREYDITLMYLQWVNRKINFEATI